MKETLHCEIGNHDWERERTRGRKPTSCPEHKPQPETSSSGANGGDMSHAREAKKRIRSDHMTQMLKEVEEAKLSDEHRRQTNYIVEQLTERKRDPQDVSILSERLTQILKDAKRQERGNAYAATANSGLSRSAEHNGGGLAANT